MMGIQSKSQASLASVFSLSLHRLKRHGIRLKISDPGKSVFKVGRNIWKKAHASRVAFLVDGDEFFRAFAEAASRAERQIFIIGWDTDTRTELPWPQGLNEVQRFQSPGIVSFDSGFESGFEPGGDAGGDASLNFLHGFASDAVSSDFGQSDLADEVSGGRQTIALGEFLFRLVQTQPELKIYVLTWDFAFIYLFEREAFPGFRFSTLSNDRLRFVLDRQHPKWASQHQKLIVIDDQVAFSGGLDITQRRWDTPEHRGFDERRVDPGGHCYGPFHDVQICVEGDVAKALGDIARERWRTATGESLCSVFQSVPHSHSKPQIREESEPMIPDPAKRHSLWPPGMKVEIRDVECGIARTLPPAKKTNSIGSERRSVREVERLFLDSIRSAKHHVYIENQYFTSPVLAKAIARRLKDPLGPEFVLVLPRDQTGLIEESTMGVLRAQALEIVKHADQFDRFRCYYPIVPGIGEDYLKVHSKVMIVDDSFIRIGSANMNNRSLGLDSECDLAIESGDRMEVRAAIAQFRSRLLGEHLGVDPVEFQSRFLVNGSLVKTVESFRGGKRTLVDLPKERSAAYALQVASKFLPLGAWLDPRSPDALGRWFTKRLGLRFRRWIPYVVILIFLSLLFTFERETFLRWNKANFQFDVHELSPERLAHDSWQWIRSWNPEKIASTINSFRTEPWAIPFVIFGFTIGSFLFIPITAMIVGVALTYPLFEALFLSLGGSMISALAMYGVGRYWAWTKSRTFARSWAQKLADQMQRGGIWSVTLVRLTPIAPFAAVGIVAGGLRIRLRDYAIGTLLGLLPGSIAVVVVSNGAVQWLFGGSSFEWLAVSLSVVLILFSFLRLIARVRRSGA